MEASLAEAWLAAWRPHILAVAKRRYCDTEMGEELGWLVSPLLSGFHFGYLATGEPEWVDRFVDWADAWSGRAIEEPDGFPGWPKEAGASTDAVPPFLTDNLLGEAMALQPMALMAGVILGRPELAARHGPRARAYLDLNRQVYEKWDRRGCWREVAGGGLWVVPPFGLQPGGGRWTEGHARRLSDGFSLPANKQNLVALWLLALHAVTHRPEYRERAALWWQVMRGRIREREGGTSWVWNYWDPGGPWDWRADGQPRHWVGVHPNGGYYALDAEGIVAAHEHGLVFSRQDIDRLIATQRDFMWSGRIADARFGRIDGGAPDPRWKDSPGCLWPALAPYDPTLRAILEANHRPDSWGGLAATPRYIAAQRGRLRPPGG